MLKKSRKKIKKNQKSKKSIVRFFSSALPLGILDVFLVASVPTQMSIQQGSAFTPPQNSLSGKSLKNRVDDPKTTLKATKKKGSDPPSTATVSSCGNSYDQKWKKAIHAIRLIKQQQRVRFIIDPHMNSDITDCPIEEDDCTVDESLVHYVDSKTQQDVALFTKER